MGATYTRQSSYTDGDVITAAHTNDEFNQLLAAFASSTGHTHDGTTAEGGPITKLLGNTLTLGAGTSGTDVTVTFDGETNDGVLKWMEDEDYFEFSDDILVASTEKLQFRDSAIYINSSADGQLDLVADTEIQIAATTVDINGAVDVSGNLTVGGSLSLATDSINIDSINGVTATVSELNILDGVTATATELNILDGVTATTAELNIMDGVTATASELNILDGVTSTAAELNILDGVTSTASELNILDGVTATATELNYSDTGSSVGTVVASKVVTADANKDVASFRNITLTGELDVGSLDVSGDADIDGTLEADAITVDGTALNEYIADTVGAMVSSNTETNIAVTYDDSDNTLDFVVAASLTSITSLYNSSLAIGYSASDANIDFSTDNSIIFDIDGTSQIQLDDGVLKPTTDDDVDLGTSSLQFKNAYFDGTVEADAYTVDGTALDEYIADTAGAMFSSNTESGITVTYQDADNTIDLSVDAAQTGITSLLATDIKIGEDDQTKIDFETADEIHFYAANAEQVYVADGVFGPQTDSDVDLGTTSVRWKDAYIDSATVTDNVTIGGNLTVNGTTTTVATTNMVISDNLIELNNGASSNSNDSGLVIERGSTGDNAIFMWDESADTFVLGTTTATGASTGNLTVTDGALQAGSLDISGNVDIDGTLETDALSIGSTTVTSTAAELNIMDGGTSATSTTLADADRIVTNDDGTMKQVALTDVKTYLSSAGFSTDDPTALAIALG